MAMKDGGPAFPYSALQPDAESRQLAGTMYADNEGMSLRDYFAGQALHGFCAMSGFNFDNQSFAAKKCYALADAMLAERDKL